MTDWKILGIEPTEDISVIKKAYAQKLKIHHPEDDPEGYQRLREAYDNTLKRIQRMKQKSHEPVQWDPMPDIVDKEEQQEPSTQNLYLKMPFDTGFHEAQTIAELNAAFMSQVDVLYHDFFSRIKLDNWKALLENDAVWKIGNGQLLSRRMLEYLKDHRYLPQEVWQLLNSAFHWVDQEEINSIGEEEELLEYIRQQLERQNPLSYAFFTPDEPVDYDRFLEYREKALNAYEQKQFEDFERYIGIARGIYSKDPDLLYMEAIYNLRRGYVKEALDGLTSLLQINPNDSRALLYRAVAFLECSQKDRACQDFSRHFARLPDNVEIPLIVARAYYDIGVYEASRRWLDVAIRRKPSGLEARLLLDQVYKAIRDELKKRLDRNPEDENLRIQLHQIVGCIRNNNTRIEKLKNKGMYKVFRYFALSFVGLMVILFSINQLTMTGKKSENAEFQPAAGENQPVATPEVTPSTAPSAIEIDTSNMLSIKVKIEKIQASLSDVVRLPYHMERLGAMGDIYHYFIPVDIAPDNQLANVFAGRLGEDLIIFCMDPGAVTDLSDGDGSLTLKGYIFEDPPREVVNYVKYQAMGESDLITDKYLVSESLSTAFQNNGISEGLNAWEPDDEPDLRAMSGFLIILLVFWLVRSIMRKLEKRKQKI